MTGFDVLLIIALGFSFVLHFMYGLALVCNARNDDKDDFFSW